MLDHAKFREDRILAQVQENMLADYQRGKKSREGGAQAHATERERVARAVVFFKHDQKLKRTRKRLSKNRRNQIIAEEAARVIGVKVSNKTVERDLEKYAPHLEALQQALRDGK